MEPIDADVVRTFLARLGEIQVEPVSLMLLGGSALLLLGNPRTTLDIDYVGDDLRPTDFQTIIDQVATELHLHADPVPIEHFVPLPPESESRRVFIARFGTVDAFVIDPYVIALSKLDRGFDIDIADTAFLIKRGLVNLDALADVVATALLQAAKYDMDPAEVQKHLAVVRQRVVAP